MSAISEEVIFEIILHAGNARAGAFEALKAAEKGAFKEAQEQLRQAEEEISIAHRAQADIIQQEADGQKKEVSLLVVHAQDHLMTAMSEMNLTEYLVRMHQKIFDLQQQIGATQNGD